VRSFGIFVFAFEAVHFRKNFGAALVRKETEHGEEVFFFIRGMLRRGFSEIAERIFEGGAVFGIQRTARGFRSHCQHCLEEAFDAAVAVRQQSDRVRKRALRGANGDRHGFLISAYTWLANGRDTAG
jgi:hypothetical protein